MVKLAANFGMAFLLLLKNVWKSGLAGGKPRLAKEIVYFLALGELSGGSSFLRIPASSGAHHPKAKSL
jgi:hypothetical protein